METQDWIPELSGRVGEEVKRLRLRRGFTGQDLCEACQAYGFTITPGTLSRLENGQRNAGLAEILVLARVLDVPPMLVVFPLDGPSLDVRVASTVRLSAWDAFAWATGETPLEAPAAPDTPLGVLEEFRSHNRAVQAALESTLGAAKRRRAAMFALEEPDRSNLARTAESYEAVSQQDCLELRQRREAMRGRGQWPPPLPEVLAFVDSIERTADEAT